MTPEQREAFFYTMLVKVGPIFDADMEAPPTDQEDAWQKAKREHYEENDYGYSYKWNLLPQYSDWCHAMAGRKPRNNEHDGDYRDDDE